MTTDQTPVSCSNVAPCSPFEFENVSGPHPEPERAVCDHYLGVCWKGYLRTKDDGMGPSDMETFNFCPKCGAKLTP